MRQVHPDYEVVTVQCACGASFQTRSTKTGEYAVEVCAECHPFYTGKQKLADREGRVEKFKKRIAEGEAVAAATGVVKKGPAKAVQIKKPPKMGKVVPIEVKPNERFGDDKRGGGRGGPGGGRGRGGPGAGRGGPRGREATPALTPEQQAETAAAAAAPAEGGGDTPAKE